MRVRLATREDIPELTRLVIACDASQRDWAGPVPIPTEAEEELEWDLRFARASAWIAVVEEDEQDPWAGPGPDRLVGTCAFAQGTVSRQDRTPVPGLAHVNAVFVRPDRWRRGIARMLLDAAEDAMRAAGFDRAQLFTLERSPAEQLYAALGWHTDGRRDFYPPMGLTVVAYVKTL
jgi:GNAT superfamily N-acetyltransferase